MLDFTGVKCPVCGVPFQKDDDIVVCPECGAPYHRECYQKEGRCIFPDLHEQGGEWQPPAPPKAPDVSAEIKDRECPVCGTLNGRSALFCNRCGTSLLGEPQRHNNTAAGTGAAGGTFYGSPYGSAYGGQPQPRNVYGSPIPPFAVDPMGGVSPADVLDTGVTFGDASKLVKQNTSYYMPVFRYMKQTRRNKFNFSAFFFTGAWMLYRKQYKRGVLVTALVLCLYAACILCSLFVSSPLLISMAEQAGLDLAQGLDISSPQWLTLSELILQEPGAYLKLILPTLCLGGVLVVRIVIGIFGNKMYLSHCVRTVRLVKEEGVDGDPNMTLDAKGGVNTPVAICLGICYFAFILPLIL